MIIMKNILGIVLLMASFAACSHIDEDERLIYVKPADVARCVLIEDFTGQKCSNCPTAIAEIEKIISQYGDSSVVAVSIHSGPLGFAGNANNIGLMTDTGNEYYNSWGTIDHQPMGIVDRKGKPTDYTSWATQVYKEIQESTPITLAIDNSDEVVEGTLSVNVNILSNKSLDCKLQLWIVEDSIEAMQTIPDGTVDRNYIHNHVYRAAVNGTWGENLTIVEGISQSKQYDVEIDEKWYAPNLSIVAFVYDDDGVMQVKKKHLVNNKFIN